MNENIETNVQKLRPFTKILMTIGELPTSYLMSMTYYEQIIWFTKYLQEQVIPAINTNAEAVEELQRAVNELNELYISLREYVDYKFDNLNLQEEIDNKLDEMLQDGSLQTIISTYVAGLGLNVKTLGATGNGETDDTEAIQSAIDYCKNNNISTLYFPDGEYVVSSQLDIDFSNFELKGFGNAVLKYVGDGISGSIINIKGTSTADYIENIKIHDIKIDGTYQTYKGGATEQTPQVTSTAPIYKGLRGINGSYCGNVRVYNCDLNEIYGDGIKFSRCFEVKVTNNTLNNCSGGNPRNGGISYDDFGDGITIFAGWNCEISSNSVVNTRVYQASNTATDIGTICGRSGLEFEYNLHRDGIYTPKYDLFSELDSQGLIMNNNYVYGYTKGVHLEADVVSTITGNTLIHNGICLLTSSKGYMVISNNHLDDDSCSAPIQSGYDSYAGGIAVTNYTDNRVYGDLVISNNVFRGSRKGIGLAKGRVIINGNTFYNDTTAIYTVTSCPDVVISNNAFYNNLVQDYNNYNWIYKNNIFYNTTIRCLAINSARQRVFDGNTFYNSITMEGTCEDILFTNNTFKTDSSISLYTNNSFIHGYKFNNLILKNNKFLLNQNNDAIGFRITSDVKEMELDGNVFRVANDRTASVNALTSNVTNLNVHDNIGYGFTPLLKLIAHSWNLTSGKFKNNILNEPLAYIIYQSSGSDQGKFEQENNIGMFRFQNVPNSQNSRFVNHWFNKGEILHNFNTGASITCTQTGYYVTEEWEADKSYSTNKLVLNNGYVYKATNSGTSEDTPANTTIGTTETGENDNITWLCCGQVAILS